MPDGFGVASDRIIVPEEGRGAFPLVDDGVYADADHELFVDFRVGRVNRVRVGFLRQERVADAPALRGDGGGFRHPTGFEAVLDLHFSPVDGAIGLVFIRDATPEKLEGGK